MARALTAKQEAVKAEALAEIARRAINKTRKRAAKAAGQQTFVSLPAAAEEWRLMSGERLESLATQ